MEKTCRLRTMAASLNAVIPRQGDSRPSVVRNVVDWIVRWRAGAGAAGAGLAGTDWTARAAHASTVAKIFTRRALAVPLRGAPPLRAGAFPVSRESRTPACFAIRG